MKNENYRDQQNYIMDKDKLLKKKKERISFQRA